MPLAGLWASSRDAALCNTVKAEKYLMNWLKIMRRGNILNMRTTGERSKQRSQ